MTLTTLFPLNNGKMAVLLEIYLEDEDYLRNIERKTKINPSLLHRNLKSLLKSGFLSREKKGREYFYSISEEEKNLIIPFLERYHQDKVIGRHPELKALVKFLYGNPELMKNCARIYLFGSFASGKVGPESDIDILFVTLNKKLVIRWCSETSIIIGRIINPLIYTPKMFKQEWAKNEPLLVSVVKSLRNRVVLK